MLSPKTQSEENNIKIKESDSKVKNNNRHNKDKSIDDNDNILNLDISNINNNSSLNKSKKQISKKEKESENRIICSAKSISSKEKDRHKYKVKDKNRYKKEENNSSSKRREKHKEKIMNLDIPIELKKKDPQYLNEYSEDILETLLTEEYYFIKKKYIEPHYLENADSEITPEMRTVAVDWLVLIHHKIFKFKENTFFLAVQLFDRYLSKIILSVEKTESLLLTSFTLASKHEEVEYVNMQETLQLAQNKFTKEQIINMEYQILSQVNFEVLAPTMCDFFKIYAFLINLNNNKIFQGFYIMNIILVDFHMLEYPNFVLALAVIKLINKKIDKELLEIVNKIIKKKKLENFEGYINNKKINSICNKIKLLYETFLETKYKNIQEKFAESQYNCVSTNTQI